MCVWAAQEVSEEKTICNLETILVIFWIRTWMPFALSEISAKAKLKSLGLIALAEEISYISNSRTAKLKQWEKKQ